jgi:fluoride exporter
MSIMRALILVAIGGVVGAGARWGAAETLPHDAGAFPWATLLVNLLGCALIGWCSRWLRSRELWLLLVTGGLGGFTTFSSFAVEVRALTADGNGSLAAAYVVASVAGGIVATRVTAGTAPVGPRVQDLP